MKKSAMIAAMFLGFCGAAQAAGLDSLAVNASDIRKAALASEAVPVPAAPAAHQAYNHACAYEAASYARLALDAKANAYGFIAGDIDLDTMIVEGMTRDGGFIYTLTGYIYKGEYFITVVTDSSCGAEQVHLREVLEGENPVSAVRPYRNDGRTASKTSSQGAQLRCSKDGWTLGVTIDGMAGSPRLSPFILFKDGAMVTSGAFEKEYEGYDSVLLNAYAWTFRNALGGLAVAADGFTAPAPGTWPAMAEIALETPAGFFEAAGAECTLTIK
jgi:hypothetical protein